jgi:hypothetical protein
VQALRFHTAVPALARWDGARYGWQVVILRSVAGLVAIVSMTIAVLTAQTPQRAFVWDPDTCCCHHAGPCPCPGHQLPQHERTPSLHKCGSGGHEVVSPSAPSFEAPPDTIALAAATSRAPAIAIARPHAPPSLEPPSAPS